jgi:hypothetical protein
MYFWLHKPYIQQLFPLDVSVRPSFRLATRKNRLAVCGFTLKKKMGTFVIISWENEILIRTPKIGGRYSSIGIATGYGLDGPGIESQWG